MNTRVCKCDRENMSIRAGISCYFGALRWLYTAGSTMICVHTGTIGARAYTSRAHRVLLKIHKSPGCARCAAMHILRTAARPLYSWRAGHTFCILRRRHYSEWLVAFSIQTACDLCFNKILVWSPNPGHAKNISCDLGSCSHTSYNHDHILVCKTLQT